MARCREPRKDATTERQALDVSYLGQRSCDEVAKRDEILWVHLEGQGQRIYRCGTPVSFCQHGVNWCYLGRGNLT